MRLSKPSKPMKSNMATSFTHTMRTAYSTSMKDFLKQGEDIWRGENVIHNSQGYLCMAKKNSMAKKKSMAACKDSKPRRKSTKNSGGHRIQQRDRILKNTSDSNTELKIRRNCSACSGRVEVRAEAMLP
ncbi:uncharacterized protein [Watersipora subatra]|uniref:uncharacterized protein n=1 Tax=Watersipora subatra TaxID=2589382 RepID=UPI00355B8607